MIESSTANHRGFSVGHAFRNFNPPSCFHAHPGGWHLLLAYHGTAVDASGENAGPKPNHPKTTAVLGDGWDRQLKNAISRLIGE